MFLGFCSVCKGNLYSSDEVATGMLGIAHIECAERANWDGTTEVCKQQDDNEAEVV